MLRLPLTVWLVFGGCGGRIPTEICPTFLINCCGGNGVVVLLVADNGVAVLVR